MRNRSHSRSVLHYVALAFLLAFVNACAMFNRADPAAIAADALRAEAAAHRLAVEGCAAYEAALVARLVKADPKVTGECAALRE